MLTILCVLKSGGRYDAGWVRRLRQGVEQNIAVDHRFVCMSDMDVPCERIALEHDWPGWWSKLEVFRPHAIVPPCLYLDLDTAVVGPIGELAGLDCDFAMLRDFNHPGARGSGVMFFGKAPPLTVYTKFKANPATWMHYHETHRRGAYVGDQAFIADALPYIDCLQDHLPTNYIVSYKKHCANGLPAGARIVAFHGSPKNLDVREPWLEVA